MREKDRARETKEKNNRERETRAKEAEIAQD